MAAVLARVALATGDPVGLYWLGGRGHAPLSPASGREAFERVLFALESIEAEGDLSADSSALKRALASIARRARRGAIVVLLSDLLDLPEGSLDRFAALGSGGRMLVAVQVLDPEESSFPFSGTVRLRPLEGRGIVETDAGRTRTAYLSALDSLRSRWSERLRSLGGLLVPVSTTDDIAAQVRALLAAVAGRGTHEKEPA
jgi:uncharacterized protein (DUF58 family)